MITRETRPYEILVRFNPDGYQGSHVIDFEVFVEDGKIVGTPTTGMARGITQAEVGEIIGLQNAALIEAADTARSEAKAAIEAVQAEAQRIVEEVMATAERMVREAKPPVYDL